MLIPGQLIDLVGIGDLGQNILYVQIGDLGQKILPISHL